MRLACLLLLMMPAASLAAEDLPGLAALNLKAQRGVDASLAELISEATLSELRSTRRFKSVIGSSDVAAMISAEQQKQALGCDEDSCLAQLGGALGVPYLLTGSLGKVAAATCSTSNCSPSKKPKWPGASPRCLPVKMPLSMVLSPR